MKDIIELINNSEFLRIVERFNNSNKDDLRMQLEAWNYALKSETFIIPILGVQGAGKSSLLNALLMDDIILPVDSDETTCIPTEIVYSKENKEEVDIEFLDGRVEKTSCNEADLKKYVHQEDNPNNIKKVKCIRIFRNSSLLRNGVTFVDLPGVGSLTENNVKTTMDYIQKSTGAIFVLRTTPPITSSESVFIKIAWPLLSKVFFVQNQWNDETLEEVIDGRDHSMIVLKKIGNESKLHDADVEIDIVNIYLSLTSKVTENGSGLEKSGLTNLENKINKFVNSWKGEVFISVKNNILVLLEDTRNCLIEEIKSLTGDKELLKKEYAKKRIEFENRFSYSKEKYHNIKEQLTEKQNTLSLEIKRTIKTSKEKFRNEIRTNLDKGITDGSKLDKVYNDLKSEQVNIIFESLDKLFKDFIFEVQKHLEEIPELSIKKSIDINVSVGIDKNTKWESLLTTGGSAAGSIGGMIGGVAIAGTASVTAASAKAGAAIGLAAGPAGFAAGIVIGAVVGFLGAFLFSKIGKEGEKAVTKSRATDAKNIIFPLIDNWSTEMTKNVQTQFSEMISELFVSIDRFYEKAEIEFNLNEKNLVENLSKNDSQKELYIFQADDDLSKLKEFYNKLKELH